MHTIFSEDHGPSRTREGYTLDDYMTARTELLESFVEKVSNGMIPPGRSNRLNMAIVRLTTVMPVAQDEYTKKVQATIHKMIEEKDKPTWERMMDLAEHLERPDLMDSLRAKAGKLGISLDARPKRFSSYD